MILTPEELRALTGYSRQAEQLAELHRRGFSRAYRNRLGAIVLERSHYDAVNAGATFAPSIDFSAIIPRQVGDVHSAHRHREKLKRTPRWADLLAIEAVYAEARRMTAETGVAHHVDHEVPLLGRRVSGLHVANNLRVIPADQNICKGNRFEP